jgi:hypothetical protein
VPNNELESSKRTDEEMNLDRPTSHQEGVLASLPPASTDARVTVTYPDSILGINWEGDVQTRPQPSTVSSPVSVVPTSTPKVVSQPLPIAEPIATKSSPKKSKPSQHIDEIS